MTEPQVWTLIGVFAAAIFGVMTLMSTLFVRVIRSEIGGLRGEMAGQIGGLRAEMTGQIGGLRGEMVARFEAVDHRFEAVDKRFDCLDRDVQALTKRVFGSQD